jgi:hypothetical protein
MNIAKYFSNVYSCQTLDQNCHDHALGLVTKVKALKGVSWKCNPGITFALLVM